MLRLPDGLLRCCRIILAFICLVGCFSTHAGTIQVAKTFKSRSLGSELLYAADLPQSLSPETAAATLTWKANNSEQLNLGFRDTPYWIKFTAANTTDQPRNLIIEVANIYLDRIDFHIFDGGGQLVDSGALGDRIPAAERRIRHAHLLHPLAIEPESSATVLMRVQSSSALSVPLTLWDRQEFIVHDFRRTVALGLFFGILAMLCSYHLIISLLTKDKSLFYYATFIFSLLFIFLLREGVVSLLIWPTSAFGTEAANIIAIGTACAGIALLTTRILKLKHALPWLDRLFYLFAGACLVPGLLVFTVEYGLLIRISLILALALTVLYVTALLLRIRDMYQAAKHLMTASIFAVLGITIAIFTVLGILPVNTLSQFVIYGCITLMALFFALAISYRINLDRQLREEAQKKLTYRLDELVREQTDELEKVNNQLKIISITDGLTGLYNRRHFDHVLATEYNRAYREQTPVAILLFDIDHFKNINDSLGHGFGDLCLKTAGQITKNIIRRPTDIAARYGGEEFAVLLPDTNLEGAHHIAERLLRAFRNETVTDHNHKKGMTVSIGVACEVPSTRGRQLTLLRRADKWLYEAKRNGRDRVEGDPVMQTS